MGNSVLPTQREKKRYVAFEVISDRDVQAREAATAILGAVHRYMGESGAAEAGIMVLTKRYDPARKRGLVRVSHKMVDKLRASLCFTRDLVIRSVGASGTLKKAYTKYIGGI
jgi:ribonuclease P/MRP protein subunit POP5